MRVVFAFIFIIFLGFGIGIVLDPKNSSGLLSYEQMIESKKADCVADGGKVEYFHYYRRVGYNYKKEESFFCKYD